MVLMLPMIVKLIGGLVSFNFIAILECDSMYYVEYIQSLNGFCTIDSQGYIVNLILYIFLKQTTK